MEKMSIELQVYLATIVAEDLSKNGTKMTILYSDAIRQLIITTKELQNTVAELSRKNSPDRSGRSIVEEAIEKDFSGDLYYGSNYMSLLNANSDSEEDEEEPEEELEEELEEESTIRIHSWSSWGTWE